MWIDLIEIEEFSPKLMAQEITIQTTDTARYTYLLRTNIENETPTLFCGPTGTGKSLNIKNLLNKFDDTKILVIELGFSAQTTCTQTQEIIDAKLDRRRKGIFGPKQGKGVVFIDDLNMPSKEKYGAQPPIEILR